MTDRAPNSDLAVAVAAMRLNQTGQLLRMLIEQHPDRGDSLQEAYEHVVAASALLKPIDPL